MGKGSKTPLFSRKQSGGMFTIENQEFTTGHHFFVDSGSATGGDTVGHGGNPDFPFLTIDYAIGQCTASNGDIIHVMPGHAETLSAAAGILIDVAGVKIVGIGWNNTKPAISVDTEHTEEAPVSWTATGCTLENIRFVGINAGGSKNVIGMTGSYNTIKGCDFIETTTDKELAIGAAYGVITLLDAGGAMTEIKILDCTMIGLAGHDESFVSVTDGSLGVSNVTIDGCKIYGTFADDIIQADVGTNVNTSWTITNCLFANLGGNYVVVTMDTGAVFFMDNLAIFGGHTTTPPIVGYTISYMGNVFTCEPGAYGATTLVGSVTNWGA